MKTREEIRMQFFTDNNGAYWTNSQEEPDIDYVYWLEDKIIKLNTPPMSDHEAYDQGFHDGANKTAIELSNGTN